MQITKRIAAIAATLSCALLLGSVFIIGTASADDAAENNAVGCAVEYYGAYEGYDNVSDWEDEIKAKSDRRQNYLDGILAKINERDDVDWSDVRSDVIKIRQDLDHAFSLASLDDIKTDLNKLDEKVDQAISDRDEEIAAEEEAARIAEEEAAAAAAYYEEYYYDYGYSGGGGYSSGGLRSAGVMDNGDGNTLTWYSQRVLGGSGLTDLNNSGRHVDDNGYVCDGDGYVAVASSDYSQGTIVDLPALGEGVQGKVYDSGCSSGIIDVYTDW